MNIEEQKSRMRNKLQSKSENNKNLNKDQSKIENCIQNNIELKTVDEVSEQFDGDSYKIDSYCIKQKIGPQNDNYESQISYDKDLELSNLGSTILQTSSESDHSVFQSKMFEDDQINLNQNENNTILNNSQDLKGSNYETKNQNFNDELLNQIKLHETFIHNEQQEELQKFNSKVHASTRQENPTNGYCFKKVKLINIFSDAENIRQKALIQEKDHKFCSGEIVILSITDPLENKIGEFIIENVSTDQIEISWISIDNNEININDYNSQRIDMGNSQITYQRMLKSLHQLRDDFQILKNEVVEYIIDKHKKYLNKPKYSILDNQSMEKQKNKLNENQQKVIQNLNENQLTLVQGPPGTGKTQTSSHLIDCYNKQAKIYDAEDKLIKPKILICGQSNNTVDNLLINLLNIQKEQEDCILRLGHPERTSGQSIKNQTLQKLSEKQDDGALRNLKNELNFFEKNNINDCQTSQIKEYLRKIYQQKKVIEKKFIENRNIIFCTCVSVGIGLLKDVKFDLILIDECTQAFETAILIPLTKANQNTRQVLIGDHKQLPPFINSPNNKRFEQSLFERLIDEKNHQNIMLNIQYRAHPNLIEFSNIHFYDSKIKSYIKKSEHLDSLSNQFTWNHNIQFINLKNSHDQNDEGSFKNELELKQIEFILPQIVKDYYNIGIITPQSRQKTLIKTLIKSQTIQVYRDIEVNTIDGFQGKEKDLIILSLVRTSSIGFLNDKKRINVALTRAKKRLIIIGNKSNLISDNYWKNFFNYINQNELCKLIDI